VVAQEIEETDRCNVNVCSDVEAQPKHANDQTQADQQRQ
jgi:hypothetical protein